MVEYNRYPAMDENNNFPPPVRKALAGSPEFKSGLKSEIEKKGLPKTSPLKRKNQEWRGNSWADKARTNFTAGESIGELVSDIYSGKFLARAVSSRGMIDAAYTVIGQGAYQFQPRSKSVVFFCDTWLNDSRYNGTSASSLLGYRYAIETIMLALTANAAVASNTSAWTYDSTFVQETTPTYTTAPSGTSTPAQGTVLSTGGSRWITSTAGATAFFNIMGPSVDITFSIPTTGGGVYEVYEGSTLIKSVNLSAKVYQEAPATISIRGLTNTQHNLKLVNKSGVMIVDSYRIPLPASNHTQIVFVPAPTMPVGGGNILPTGDKAASYDAARTLFLDILKEVTRLYPTVTIVDTNVVSWPTSVFSNDNRHLNDIGNAQLANVISEQLSGIGFTEGLNSLTTNGYAADYTPAPNPTMPTGGTIGTGSTKPPKVVTPYEGTDWHYTAESLYPTSSLDSWPAAQANMPELTRNTATFRPSVVTENGKSVVVFDGIDDSLGSTTVPRNAVETIAMLVKVRSVESGSTRRYMVSAQGGVVSTFGISSGANGWVASEGVAMNILFSQEAYSSDYKVIMFVMNGASSVYRVNATEVTGDAGTQSAKNGLIIARNSGDADNTSTPISVMDILHFPKALSSSERTAVYNYLKAKAPTAG